MRYKTTAQKNKREKKFLSIEEIIERNINAALKFCLLTEDNKDSAIDYYKALPSEVQDYIKYSPISERSYNSLKNRLEYGN